MNKGSDILAYTASYGSRTLLKKTVFMIRGSAGLWFDWAVWLGASSEEAKNDALDLLADPRHLGIQYLTMWPENRGQHYATNEALKLAREKGYKWLLRLDDDIQPKTKHFLKKMLDRVEELKTLSGDTVDRLIAAPKVVGLKNPLTPVGSISKGQRYSVDVMEILGGACRLHPVDLLAEYTAPVYEPLGCGDPESISDYTASKGGILIRFPDIRVVHKTTELEKLDSPKMNVMRRMGKVWPYLGAEA